MTIRLRIAKLGILVAPLLGAGPILYTVTPVNVDPNQVILNSLNNSGQLAGTINFAGENGQLPQAFLGTAAGGSAIPLPPGAIEAYGYALNNAGQVAGLAYFNGASGEFTQQGFVGGTSGSSVVPINAAYAINDSGQVAGGDIIATTTGASLITSPPGSGQFMTESLNNLGQVAGYLSNTDGPVPAIGTTSGATAIPTPPGEDPSGYAIAFAINNSGEVAGWAVTNSALALQQAFVGNVAGTTLIPLPPGATTSSVKPGSINDAGVVVGFSDVGDWIWDPVNGTRLLSDLVPSGWDLDNGNVFSINDSGQILVSGSNSDFTGYVLLTPIPEPSGIASTLMGLAVVGLGLLRLKKRGSQDAFDFPADMQPVRAEPNRLNDQILVRYYEKEWKDIAR